MNTRFSKPQNTFDVKAAKGLRFKVNFKEINKLNFK